jgi:hypothetical protein
MTRQEKLLDAIGKIDDHYIEEAAPPEDNAPVLHMPNRKTSHFRRQVWTAAATFIVVLGSGIAIHTMKQAKVNAYRSELAAGIEAEASPDLTQAAPEMRSKAAAGTKDANADSAALSIGNPWMEFSTLEEAEQSAGITIEAPDAYASYTSLIYRAIPGDILEILYLSPGPAGQEGFRIRKSLSSDDISGDYTSYDEEKTLTLEGHDVTLRIKDGKVGNAIWSAKDGDGKTSYSYAVDAGQEAFTEEAMLELIRKIS